MKEKLPKEYDEALVPTTEELSEKVRANEAKISELSHLDDGETGFNPTIAEMAAVFEGIKAGIKKRGEKK